MKKNTKAIKLNLTKIGLSRFQNVPTFRDLLHPSQRVTLVIGDNIIIVNHHVYSSICRMSQYDSGNISVTEVN